jgi:hypothetical protein
MGEDPCELEEENAKRRVARKADTSPPPPEHKVSPSTSDSASPVLCPSQSCSSEDPATFYKLKLFPIIRHINIPDLREGAPEAEMAE